MHIRHREVILEFYSIEHLPRSRILHPSDVWGILVVVLAILLGIYREIPVNNKGMCCSFAMFPLPVFLRFVRIAAGSVLL